MSVRGAVVGREVDFLAFEVVPHLRGLRIGRSKSLGYFRRTDGVSFDRARQVVEAKKRAIGLAESNYHPPVPRAYRLPGESGIATPGMMIDTLVSGGYASEHDAKIAKKLATVLCGVGGATREVNEDESLELERVPAVGRAFGSAGARCSRGPKCAGMPSHLQILESCLVGFRSVLAT